MKEKKVLAEMREAAAVRSRRGASKSGSRAASLTPERRREIARKAISSRWNRGRKTTDKAPRAIMPPFDPIEIPGPPLSETVIQERR